MPIVQIRLNLSSQDTDTHIKGGAYFTNYTYIIPIFGVAIAFIAILIEGIPALCFPIILGLIAVFLLLLCFQRYLVEKHLLDTFQHFKYKKQTFAWWERLVFPAIKLQREAPLSLYDLTNKLYRLHYETNYVEMRERKERYFVIKHRGAQIFGWMRVIDNEHTAIQYWIGIDLLSLTASAVVGSLWLTLFPILLFELQLAQKLIPDYFMKNFAFAFIFLAFTTLFQFVRLWRKFRTTLNTVEENNYFLLQKTKH
jgi:hypothetical protein